MTSHSLFLALLASSSLAAAEPRTLFFAKETAKESTHISLTIDGDRVTGTQVWQPKDDHGARGTLDGTIAGGGIIQVVHSYTIEGSDQSEEEVLRLDGDTLFIGQGEMVEGKGGRMNLKEPNKIAFKTSLKKVDAGELKPGTPVRKAIMDAMRGPVSGRIGKPVLFTGSVLVSDGWARFQGNVATADGKAPKNDDVAADLDLDFFALLRQGKDGAWLVVHSGFSGDVSVREDAREKFPKAPWVLFE